MSYNVRYFGHPVRGVFSTRRGVRNIAERLAGLYHLPDVVCLQEVETRSLRATRTHSKNGSGPAPLAPPAVESRGNGAEPPTQLDTLLTSLDTALERRGISERFDAYYFGAHEYRLTKSTNIYTTGLAVLAKRGLKVLDHNAKQPCDITHRSQLVRLKQTRICAHLAFESPAGDRVDVFNTHLSLPSFWSKRFWTDSHRMGFGENQLNEAALLSRFIREQKRSENVIVAGDFNSLPGSPVDQFLRSEAGLQDAYQTLHEPAAEHARRFPTAGFMNLRMHIDHLYASPSVRWLDLEGTHAFGMDGHFNGLSDHVPLIARFAVHR